MAIERDLGGCGLIQNPDNGPEAVVSGRFSSEIFNFATQTWRRGPLVPFDHRVSSAQFGDTFLVAGGYSDSITDAIYEFDHLNYSWILRSQTK